MENNSIISGDKPTVMVTNDDGIEGPGLLALVQVLVSTRRYNVLVCAPDTYLLKNHQTLKIFFTLPNSFESLFIDRKKKNSFPFAGNSQLWVTASHGVIQLLPSKCILMEQQPMLFLVWKLQNHISIFPILWQNGHHPLRQKHKKWISKNLYSWSTLQEVRLIVLLWVSPKRFFLQFLTW